MSRSSPSIPVTTASPIRIALGYGRRATGQQGRSSPGGRPRGGALRWTHSPWRISRREERTNDMELDGHHRATVAKIFNHPTSHNIQWHDVLSLLNKVATVTEDRDREVQGDPGSRDGDVRRRTAS